MKIKQKPDGHGSLRDIQLLVNKNQELIDKCINTKFLELANDKIIWHSPLSDDDYAEYRDNDFIEKIGLNIKEIALQEFWPEGGPQWDALATTTSGKIILVEAKANIIEIVTSPTKAKKTSKVLIDKSLKETKAHLGIKNNIDWSGKFYQYTNRLAHLYFLRKQRGKPAYLFNIYFIGDESVSGPGTIQEWKAAIQVLNSYLGVGRHKLSKYMGDIFIDIKDLKK